MKTYTNTKDITAKIFYDLLQSNFKEMYPKDNLQYGINHNHIVVETEGKAIYEIEITEEFIKLAEIDATEQKTGKKLDEFIKASLLPANER
jgi:type I restriction-modification system DNA methylase subunit